MAIDTLDYLVKLITNPNAKFSANPNDYILSIASSILAFFDITKKWARVGIGLLQITLSYGQGIFNKKNIPNIFADVIFLIIGEIIGGALGNSKTRKINNAKNKISKSKGKLTQAMKNAKFQNKEFNIKQKFYALGVTITFSLNISNKIINSIADLFI